MPLLQPLECAAAGLQEPREPLGNILSRYSSPRALRSPQENRFGHKTLPEPTTNFCQWIMGCPTYQYQWHRHSSFRRIGGTITLYYEVITTHYTKWQWLYTDLFPLYMFKLINGKFHSGWMKGTIIGKIFVSSCQVHQPPTNPSNGIIASKRTIQLFRNLTSRHPCSVVCQDKISHLPKILYINHIKK